MVRVADWGEMADFESHVLIAIVTWLRGDFWYQTPMIMFM